MPRKTNALIAHTERIRSLMESSGLYEARYELQIEQTAETLVEIDEIKAQIKKEGRTLKEEKTGGVGLKQAMHPLYTPLNNLQQLLIRQFAALGLNKMSEKKAETQNAKQDKPDGVQEFMRGRRG